MESSRKVSWVLLAVVMAVMLVPTRGAFKPKERVHFKYNTGRIWTQFIYNCKTQSGLTDKQWDQVGKLAEKVENAWGMRGDLDVCLYLRRLYRVKGCYPQMFRAFSDRPFYIGEAFREYCIIIKVPIW